MEGKAWGGRERAPQARALGTGATRGEGLCSGGTRAAAALGFGGAVAVRAAADRGGAAAAHGCMGDGARAHEWRKVEQDGVE